MCTTSWRGDIVFFCSAGSTFSPSKLAATSASHLL